MKARGNTEAFSREKCLALLASVPVGRVVYTDQALPAVIVVRFVLDGEEVTIHTGADSDLAATVHDAVVAFQADDLDPVTMTGWSVTIIGHARLVEGVGMSGHPVGPPFPPLTGVHNGPFIRIPARHVSGRRIGPAARAGTAEEQVGQDKAC